ncbi:MAG: hypothetical protein HGB11_15260, partial [Chlorobiales bacterium]|nr:hypothetical protein [Chlorobiales bacterium]
MRKGFHRLIFILTLTLLASCSFGEIVLKEGDTAPDFTLPSDNGQIISLSDYNIRPDLIEAAITDRTRAIIPVH